CPLPLRTGMISCMSGLTGFIVGAEDLAREVMDMTADTASRFQFFRITQIARPELLFPTHFSHQKSSAEGMRV
ncbi:hypothetical protein, partial [Brucella intermedia]|uniref:hypothetical protein n=1 Tax=Brucella intermedia TaxID=94625 RepID=UPI002362C2AB